MAEHTSPSSPAPAAAAPRRRKRLTLILIAVAALAVVGLAGFPFVYRAGTHAGEKPAEVSHEHGGGLVPVEPMLVNLADRDTQRFAKVTVRLVVGTKAEAEEIAEDDLRQAKLRSAILELLAQQTAAGLATAEGRTALKHAVADHAAHALRLKVQDVLFTDLVVQ